MHTDENRQIKLCCALFGLIYLMFFVINMYTPVIGEDLVLSVFPKDYSPSNVGELIGGMVTRIWLQMTTWNVRLGEQLSIIFSCFDKIWFNLLNSACPLLYFYLCYSYSFKRKFRFQYKDIVSCMLFFCLLFVCQPTIGEIFFWRTGSTNYLWSICILLFFLIPLRYYVGYDSSDILHDRKIGVCFFTILGFFAGVTNENTVIVFLILYIGVAMYKIKKRKPIPVWFYATFVSFLLGAIFMYCAPSTAIRSKTYLEIFGIEQVTLTDYIFRAKNIIYRFFYDNKVYIFITLTLMTIYHILLVRENRLNLKLIFNEPLLLLLLSAISCGALIMSPYVETRAFLLPDFFMLSCIMFYSEKIYYGLLTSRKEIVVFILVCVCGVCIYEYSEIYSVYKKYWNFCDKRNVAIDLFEEASEFKWGEYPYTHSTRILTTREDYLLDSEEKMEAYYGKSIECVENLIWDWDKTEYNIQDAVGYIDYVEYSSENNVLDLAGWALFENESSANNVCYLCIETEDGRKAIYKTQKTERKDVALSFEDNKYLLSGFYIQLKDLYATLGENTSDNIIIKLYLTNDANKINNEDFYELKLNLYDINNS